MRWVRFAVLLAGPAVKWGQLSTASLSGTVADEQDALLNGPKVTLRKRAKGFAGEMMAEADSSFHFAQVPAGSYELVVEKAGIAAAKFPALVLNAKDQRPWRVRLRVAARKEKLTISSQAPLVSERPAVASGSGSQER